MKEILIAFVHVFAMIAPWLVFGFLMAGLIVRTDPEHPNSPHQEYERT